MDSSESPSRYFQENPSFFLPKHRVSSRASVNGSTLHLEHSAGFFSNCSVALLEVARSKKAITRIDATRSFFLYKENPQANAWPLYFQDPHVAPGTQVNQKMSRYLYHHEDYKVIDFEAVEPLVKAYFSPSEQVLETREKLIRKYEIDTSRTLAVHFRGTDKSREVRPASIYSWLRKTKKILRGLPSDFRILLQTDELYFYERFMEEFGKRAFFFNELPLSALQTGIRKNLLPAKRESFAKTFLASVLIISRSANVITHTGNSALWTALYRGGVKNFVQM